MTVNSMLWSFQQSSKRQNRGVIRNFSGHGSFLGTTNNHLQHEKGPVGKSLQFFLLKTFKNLTHEWQQSGFYRKLGHFFPISEKGQGRPSYRHPSSYSPAKYGSDNYKTFAWSFCEIPRSGHLSLANIFSLALFPTLFFKIISPVIKIKFLQRRT